MNTRERRAARVRRKVRKVNRAGLCRLSVFRSCQHIDVQIIDDSKGYTVTAASTKEKEFKSAGMASRGKRAAEWVGKSVAERIKKVGLEAVVLDRGPNLYHAGGCLDILVSAVRSAGVRV